MIAEAISNTKKAACTTGNSHMCMCEMCGVHHTNSLCLRYMCALQQVQYRYTVIPVIVMWQYSAFFLRLWTRLASNLHFHLWDITRWISITPMDPVPYFYSSMFTSEETVVAGTEPPPSTELFSTVQTTMIIIIIVKGGEWFPIVMPQCVMEPWRSLCFPYM